MLINDGKNQWAIGIFEGEGNIYRNDKRRNFVMSVKMKDEDIIKRFYDIVGCGKVVKRKAYLNYDCMWEWRVTRTNEILELANKIFPFMGERRKEQISNALKGKHPVRERKILEEVPECGFMEKGEISARGAKRHVRKGELPCKICAENQRLYLREWRKAFFKANQ